MFVSNIIAALTGLLGIGGLLGFYAFLILGTPTIILLKMSEPVRLIFDTALSSVFFLQHSVMVRRSFRQRMKKYCPEPYQSAVYSIISGFVLILIVLFWQRSDIRMLSLDGPLRVVCHTGLLLAMVLFFWVISSLNAADPFGIRNVRDHRQGRQAGQAEMVIRGPYRWVRHPAYLCNLLVIWCYPDITGDRLLLNILWTAWSIAGTYFEERDLIVAYGERYRIYQRQVPRLLPLIRRSDPV
jgi:methanethiol S-methyltransferase